MRRGSRVGSRVGGMDGGLIGVDVDGDGVTDFTLPVTPSMDPDHEPFALVDLFMSPHRPLVPVWVNNVVSITVYAGALALFFLVLLQTGSETYRETEISQHVMTGGGPGSRTGKRDVECRCLSKLTASLDLEDPVLADGGSWRVVSDIALPSAANCERQFADLPVEDAHVVAYDGARGDAYGFCYSAAANRTWAPLARTAAGPCRDALDGTTPSADVSNMIVVKMRVCPQGGRRLQPGSGNGPTGQGQGQGQGQGPGVGQGAPGGGGGGCYDNATAAVAAWNDARVFASFCREFEDHPPYICSWYRYYGYARVLSIAHGSVDFLLVLVALVTSFAACAIGEGVHSKRKGVGRVVTTLVTGRRPSKVEAMADPEPPRTAQPGGDLAVTVAQLRRDLDETRRLLDEVRRDPRLAAAALPPIKGRPLAETKEGQDAELSDALASFCPLPPAAVDPA